MKREKARRRQAAYLERESQEEREARLQRARDYKHKVKSQEVLDAEKDARRKYERNKKREQRARETKEEKDARLQKIREYRAGSFPKEQPKQAPISNTDPRKGARKLEYDRNQKRLQRANETPEQREARLEKMRQYSAERRANKEMKTSAKVKKATKERMDAFRAKRSPEEIEQDKAAAKERMDNFRSNRTDEDKTLAWIARNTGPKKHDVANCKVRKWRLLKARGGDAPEPLMENGTGRVEYCHHCDQDLSVPLAGKGRCPCRDCAVLFDKLDEYYKRRSTSNY